MDPQVSEWVKGWKNQGKGNDGKSFSLCAKEIIQMNSRPGTRHFYFGATSK